MESKYEQLTKLKALLDSGVLTQEEFDAAKKRVLDADNQQNHTQETETPTSAILNADNQKNKPQQEQDDAPSSPGESTNIGQEKDYKWIVFCGMGVLAIIMIIAASLSSGNESYDSYNPEDEMVIEDTMAVEAVEYAYDYAEESGDGLTIGNPWQLDYFKNEWGEYDKSQPMIYTTLQGSGWNIHIDYQKPNPSSTASSGMFRFYLEDNEGHKTDSYGPVQILVRGSDGETKLLQVTGTRDGVTFVEDPANVAGFMEYLNSDNFDLLMEFEKYNERHRTKARWDAPSGSFNEAYETLLN